jgi:predicted acylesterase/phospholipase RssA
MLSPECIQNLVFSGGGVRGYSYVGVLKELVWRGVRLERLRGCGGTSMGALLALLVVCGWTPADLETELLEVALHTKLNLGLSSLYYKFGLDDGVTLRSYLEQLVRRTYKGVLTFRDLEAHTKKRLLMVGTDLNDNAEVVFSYETTPDMNVIDACYMSMAVPGLFAPLMHHGHLIVDGGIKNNFPLKYFPPDSTLGVRVTWGHAAALGSADQVLARVVYCMLTDAESAQWTALPSSYKDNTISVEVGDLSTIELRLTPEHKRLIIHRGQWAVRRAFLQCTRVKQQAENMVGLAYMKCLYEISNP